ncbi:MAG: hypothetical protein ACM3O4_05965 [Ignavibacteriales bacterium]
MSKININQNAFKGGKPHKLYKTVIATIGAITLTISIAGGIYVFNNLSEYHKFKDSYQPSSYTSQVEPTKTPTAPTTGSPAITTNQEVIEIYNPTLGITESDLSKVNTLLNSANYNQFKNYIEDIDVVYPNEDLFGIDAALSKYNQLTFDVSNHSGDILKDASSINASQLMNIIIENNKVYLDESSNKIGGGKVYDNLSNKDLLEVCQIITDTFNYHLEKGLIDADKASCNLAHLKIFKAASPDMAFMTKDNCLVISPDMVSVLQIMNPNIDAYRNTIIHEVMHIFQDACIDVQKNNGFDTNYGPAYAWPNLKTNPLMWDWFIEAAAEKNANNYTGDDASTYHNMIGYLEGMSLVTILDDDVNVNQTERLTFDNRLKPLFEQFNCITDEQKKELIKMMYSLDIMHMQTEDFVKIYEEKYGTKLNTADFDKLNYQMKGSICTTLTKYFYLNLAEQIKDKNLSLQDTFFLITLFESELNSHLKYTRTDLFEYNEDFMNQYVDIQDHFLKALSQGNNYTSNELLDLYDNYGMTLLKDGTKSPNYNLSWLSNDKKNYLLSREKALHNISTGNIRNSYENTLSITHENVR